MSQAHRDTQGKLSFGSVRSSNVLPSSAGSPKLGGTNSFQAIIKYSSCVSCNNPLHSPSAPLESSVPFLIQVMLPKSPTAPFPVLFPSIPTRCPLGRQPGAVKAVCSPISLLRVAGSPDAGEEHLAVSQHPSSCSTSNTRTALPVSRLSPRATPASPPCLSHTKQSGSLLVSATGTVRGRCLALCNHHGTAAG